MANCNVTWITCSKCDNVPYHVIGGKRYCDDHAPLCTAKIPGGRLCGDAARFVKMPDDVRRLRCGRHDGSHHPQRSAADEGRRERDPDVRDEDDLRDGKCIVCEAKATNEVRLGDLTLISVCYGHSSMASLRSAEVVCATTGCTRSAMKEVRCEDGKHRTRCDFHSVKRCSITGCDEPSKVDDYICEDGKRRPRCEEHSRRVNSA